MVCSNFHSTRVCKLCLFLFAQFIVPYLEEYFRIDGTSQEEIEKELIQQVLDILSERWIKANETKSAFTTDNLGIIEIEKSI